MFKKKKILVIDDGLDSRKLLKEILIHQHFNVVEATNGTQGIQMAQEEKPDAIVLDLMMPERDGIEIYRALQNDSNTKEIPILFLTALAANDGLTRDGLELMAMAKHGQTLDLKANCVILGKTFTPQKLVRELQRIVGK